MYAQIYLSPPNNQRLYRLGVTLLIGLICLYYASIIYAQDLNAINTVGETTFNLFSVGQTTFNQYSAGEVYVPPAPAVTTPLDAYFGASVLLKILPGLLLLCFVIWFFYLGFKEVKQSKVLPGLACFLVAFVLIGLTLIVAMPIILDGAQAMMWFK